MKTKCTTCKFCDDFSESAMRYCYEHDQTHAIENKKRIVLTCTGYQEAKQPHIVDKKTEPAKVETV